MFHLPNFNHHFQVPHLVGGRVAGGLRGRPAAHRQEPAHVHLGTEAEPVLAGAARESIRKVRSKCLESNEIIIDQVVITEATFFS